MPDRRIGPRQLDFGQRGVDLLAAKKVKLNRRAAQDAAGIAEHSAEKDVRRARRSGAKLSDHLPRKGKWALLFTKNL